MADLTDKAVKMLLKGATLLSDPCPYCKGVRVMQDGNALCVGCGRQPEKKEISQKTESPPSAQNPAILTLEKKLESLSRELESESDHKRQQEILSSINALVETISNMRAKLG